MASSNRLSYSTRLFLWLVGYSVLLVGCFIAYQYHREKEFRAEKINAQLQLINTYILTELTEGHKAVDIRLDEFSPFSDIRVSVISDKGDVLYDNSIDSLPHSNHLDRAEIRDAMRNGTGYTVRRHSESTGESYFYAAKRGTNGVIVRTAVPYSVSLHALLETDYGFIWSMGAVAVAMCILGYFATARVGLHVSRLNRFAENVEKGARISDSEPFPHDELGEISNHIVRLYARLQKATADRDSEHRAALHEQREKERIKKQLTNNINHELKTPVASIRICIETLLSHPELTSEKREKFLQKCLWNTERLQHLLADVALITRMDEGSQTISKEKTDLSEVIQETVDDHRLAASAAGISIIDDVERGLMLHGNRMLLETIFNNLLDNAISYSRGSWIRITGKSGDDGKITVMIADNGIGVPAEHLPRIFERFYRIEKGRSRVSGGTGLGLSIVRNAVALHGGSISARNNPEGGLTFTITFTKL